MKLSTMVLSLVASVFVVLSFSGDVFAKELYVSAESGNDANNGETPATAVATIQYANDIAVNGDGITIYPGTYGATTITKKLIHMNGVGKVLIEPQVGDGTVGLYYTGGYTVSEINNITFKGWSTGLQITAGFINMTVNNCKFISNNYGFFMTNGNIAKVTNCLFESSTTVGLQVFWGAAGIIKNNTFVSCSTGMYFSSEQINVTDNVFSNCNISMDGLNASLVNYTIANNCFYPLTGGASDHFYRFQNMVEPDLLAEDGGNFDEDPLFLDAANGVYLLQEASRCYGSGLGTVGSFQTNIGAFGMGKVINNTTWTNGFGDWYVESDFNTTVSLSTQVEVFNAHLRLSTGLPDTATVKSKILTLTLAPEKEYVTRVSFDALESYLLGAVIDTTTASVERSLEIKTGNTLWAETENTGFIEINDRADLSASLLEAKYIQVRLTLVR